MGTSMTDNDYDCGSAEPGGNWISFIVALVYVAVLVALTRTLWLWFVG